MAALTPFYDSLVNPPSIGGGGSLIVATRSDNSNPAVFASIAARDTYTATLDGTADAARIEVSAADEANEVFAVGTLNGSNQVTSITAAYIRLNGAWVAVATNLVGTPGTPGSAMDFSGVGTSNIPVPGTSPAFSPTDSGLRATGGILYFGNIADENTMRLRRDGTNGHLFFERLESNVWVEKFQVSDSVDVDVVNFVEAEVPASVPANGLALYNRTIRDNLGNEILRPFFTDGTNTFPAVGSLPDGSVRIIQNLSAVLADPATVNAVYKTVAFNEDLATVATSGSYNDLTDRPSSPLPNSGRAFTRFNDGFTIDASNIATYADRNNIYTAKNDKPFDSDTRPDVNLPTDAQIAAGGESYPVPFEFTHLGGTARFEDRNIVRFFVDGSEIGRINRDEVAVIVKPAAGEPYEIQTSSFDPNDTILPGGTFNLKTDSPITSIATIAIELASVVIVSGDAYLVETGGTWRGQVIPDSSVLVALVSSASLVDEAANEDWLLLDNGRINAAVAMLLANFIQDGVVYNANRNIKIDPSNVVVSNIMATGAPQTRQIGTNTQGFNRQIRYDGVSIQFADLVGGRLDIMFSHILTTQSGSLPAPLTLDLVYGGTTFTFDISGVPFGEAPTRLSIPIPSEDYSPILNTDVSLRWNYNFTGESFFGSFTVAAALNQATGTLHDAIAGLIQTETVGLKQDLENQIAQVIGDVDADEKSIEAILPRLSPPLTISESTPAQDALFLNSTGVDAFPSDLSSFTSVSAANPRFTGGDVALFVAIDPPGTFVLHNITTDTVLALDDSEATVDLGESLSNNGTFYFVYRVTGLTSGHVYELERISTRDVSQWPHDIESNRQAIARNSARLDHAVLDLPDALVQVLANEVTVDEEDNATIAATAYNNSLTGTGAQAIFYETNPNAEAGGILNSKPINETTGPRARRKLAYLPASTAYGGGNLIWAFDGTTTRNLISYTAGVFSAKQFIAAIPAGTRDEPRQSYFNGTVLTERLRHSPAENLPATGFTASLTGQGEPDFWQEEITLHIVDDANGAIDTTADLVFLASDTDRTYTVPDANITLTVRVFRNQARNTIDLEVTFNVSPDSLTEYEADLTASYTRTVTVPATPDTVRDVRIDGVHDNPQVFAFYPSSAGTLVISGSEATVDTGYAYTTLFGAGETGHLSASATGSTWLDFQNYSPRSGGVTDLENHAALLQFGLFTTLYTHETIVELATQLTVLDSTGTVRSVGDVLTDLLTRVEALEP